MAILNTRDLVAGARHVYTNGLDSNLKGTKPLSATALAFIASLVVVYTLTQIFMTYVLSGVVGTLAIVEEPQPAQPRSAAKLERSSDDEKKGLMDVDHEDNVFPAASPLVSAAPPITSSIRATIRHIKSQEGRAGLIRGGFVRMVYMMALSCAMHLRYVLPFPVARVLALIVVSPLDTLWKTTVMTKASDKYWYQRLPSWKTSRKVLLPTAIFAIAKVVPRFMVAVLAESTITELENQELTPTILLKAALPLLTEMVLFVLLEIPASVTLTRTQLSLLPEEEKETIVPTDRTFGGRVVPEAEGGSGVIGLLDAWRTFNWNSRLRLIMLYVKIAAINFAIVTAFGAIAVFTISASPEAK